MSGFEVIGVVLAVLPIAVKAAYTYRDIFKSYEKVAKEIEWLANEILTEHVRLRASVEKLLSGIVSPSNIYVLLDDPCGPESKKSEHWNRICARLWDSAAEFEALLQNMKEAANELNDKLMIKEGKAALLDKRSVLAGLKAKTGFTLKRKDYDDALSRLRAANLALESVTRSNCELEPTRQRFSQYHLTKLVRNLASSLYMALGSALTCACSHRVSLELVVRNVFLHPGVDMEEKSKDFGFHIVLGMTLSQEDAGVSKVRPCYGLRLQRGDFKTQVTTDTGATQGVCDASITLPILTLPGSSTPTQKHDAKNTLKWEKIAKPVKSVLPQLLGGSVASHSSATHIFAHSVVARMPIIPRFTPHELRDMCDAVRNNNGIDCYGYICNADDMTFGVYPHKTLEMDKPRTLTLREVLEREGSDLPIFDCEEKLKVAASLAASVLHLHDTPWIAKIVTLDDVVFIMSDVDLAADGAKYTPYSAFVSVNPPNRQPATIHQAPTVSPRAFRKRPFSLASASLGLVLINLIRERPVVELEITTETDQPKILQRCLRGTEYEHDITTGGTYHYWNAGMWCLNSVQGAKGLEDEEFCQKFYEGVVTPLKVAHENLVKLKAIEKNGP